MVAKERMGAKELYFAVLDMSPRTSHVFVGTPAGICCPKCGLLVQFSPAPAMGCGASTRFAAAVRVSPEASVLPCAEASETAGRLPNCQVAWKV